MARQHTRLPWMTATLSGLMQWVGLADEILQMRVPTECTLAQLLALTDMVDGERRVVTDLALPTEFRYSTPAGRWLPTGGIIPLARGGAAAITGVTGEQLVKSWVIPPKLIGPAGRVLVQLGMTAGASGARVLAIKINSVQIQSTSNAFSGATGLRTLTDIRSTGVSSQAAVISIASPYSASTAGGTAAINTDTTALTVSAHITPTAPTDVLTLTDSAVDIYPGV